MTDYADDWDSCQNNGDTVILGSLSNIYPGKVEIRHTFL